MIQVYKAAERGRTHIDWLDSRHTFSFGDYYDPDHMGFRALRVINDDHVAPGAGFGMHPHRDMEIVTYVLQGALEHRDSLGTGSILHAGELQRMTAGTGIMHSEFNSSKKEPVHLYQIWLLPQTKGLQPSYEQKAFAPAEQRGHLRAVVTPDGRDGALRIHQDVEILLGSLDKNEKIRKPLAPGRHAWVQCLAGHLSLNELALAAGDGVAISNERAINLAGIEAAQIMVFDLA
jgi:redox-sensitive bicupin YhaK (pirin superfamily)